MTAADHATVHVLAIHSLVYRFMQSFDEKDWTLMRACLADRVHCDYSSFRGTPPGEVDADEYVELRRAALSPLRMQHDVSNLQVNVTGDRAEGRCNYTIRRFALSAEGAVEDFFHSYGHYRFGFTRSESGWKLREITQVLLANEGNRSLHAGAKPQR